MRRWWEVPEGWLSLPLLLLLALTVAGSIQEARWDASLRSAMDMLSPVALGGVLAGFVLTRIRRLPQWAGHSLGLLAGLATIVQLSGSLRSVRVATSGEIVHYLSPNLHGWKDLAIELLIRLIALGRAAIQATPGEDIVLFIIVLAFVCWQVGFWGSWFTFRSRQPWLAVALPAAILLLNIQYSPQVPTRFFNYFATLALFFLITVLWHRQEERWKEANVRYPTEIGGRVLWVGAVLSVGLVLLAILLPTTAAGQETANFWDRYLEPWKEARATWERLFSRVEGERPGSPQVVGYSFTFELGGARIAPEGDALEVRSSRNEYLRGMAFDRYSGAGWINTAGTRAGIDLPAGWPLDIDRSRRVRNLQIITPLDQGGTLVLAVAEPLTLTLPVSVRLGTPSTVAGGFEDIVSLHTPQGLVRGRSYAVVSLLSAANKRELRAAGLEYPDWVLQRYLQLPDALPERVWDLADEIVAGALRPGWENAADPPVRLLAQEDWRGQGPATLVLPAEATGDAEPLAVLFEEGGRVVRTLPHGVLVQSGWVSPYDAAEAIEGYLRTHLTYREDISAPPAGRDAVDYFLFEQQAGYCDYFASAMVVLLRTQGIPARLVRGYATGTYNPERGAYIVPISSAHTWPEVYFPGYGWQRFEPTAADYTSRPNRPEGLENDPTRRPDTPGLEPGLDEEGFTPLDRVEEVKLAEETATPLSWGGALRRPAVVVPLVLLLLGVGAVGVTIVRTEWGLHRLGPVAATYERMCRWEDLAGLVPAGQPTPFEYAEHLAEALPAHRSQIALIATLYVRERFGRHSAQPEELERMRKAWGNVRWPLWGRLLQRLRQFRLTKAEEKVNERHNPLGR